MPRSLPLRRIHSLSSSVECRHPLPDQRLICWRRLKRPLQAQGRWCSVQAVCGHVSPESFKGSQELQFLGRWGASRFRFCGTWRQTSNETRRRTDPALLGQCLGKALAIEGAEEINCFHLCYLKHRLRKGNSCPQRLQVYQNSWSETLWASL